MRSVIFTLILSAAMFATPAAYAFGGGGCGEGKCSDCHKLSKEQAADALSSLKIPFEVDSVGLSEVPGLWEVVVKRSDNMKIPVFLDFSLKYMLQGEIYKLATVENITRTRVVDLNKVDVSTIPLDDAIVMGNPKAKHKIIVFDDPECPYCLKIQESMKEVTSKRNDIAFYIKMLPLEIHPSAYEKAKAIICEKSLDLLEKSLNKGDVPPAKCKTDQIEKNRELAKNLRIGSTPTLVFPDGRAMPGYKSAEEIIKNLMEDDTLKTQKK